MRVGTWNVFLAPLMPERHARLPRVLQTLTQLVDEHHVELLVLQELHGYCCGPWAARLRRWLPTGRLADLLAILCSQLEGWCGAEAPVHAPFRHAVVAHAATLGLVHVATAPPATKRAGVMDCGVVVLSKHPLGPSRTVHMQGDMIHTPGVVTTTVRNLRVWGCHLLPRLPPTRWEYRLVRFFHTLCGVNADAIGNQNVQQLRAELRAPALVLGDMNAKVQTVADQCPELRLLTPDENTLCPLEPEGPTCLDHIWGLGLTGTSGFVVRAPGAGLLADRLGADHFPVVVDIPC
jgi:endonuclease/exonuclease/phosphatase family metal-dependent hydrolase